MSSSTIPTARCAHLRIFVDFSRRVSVYCVAGTLADLGGLLLFGSDLTYLDAQG